MLKFAKVLAFNLFNSSLKSSISSVYLFAISNNFLLMEIFLKIYVILLQLINSFMISFIIFISSKTHIFFKFHIWNLFSLFNSLIQFFCLLFQLFIFFQNKVNSFLNFLFLLNINCNFFICCVFKFINLFLQSFHCSFIKFHIFFGQSVLHFFFYF